MNKEIIKQEVIALIGEEAVMADAPMKDQISFRAGGTVDFLVSPQNLEALAVILNYCRKKNLPFFIMGNGSNLLVKDGGYRGVIIKTRQLEGIEVTKTTMTVSAGTLLRKVAEAAWRHSLTGLEFASGIPGTMGGAVFMNAGAYDGEMKQIVKAVEAMDFEGGVHRFTVEDCDLGYRHSRFQNEDLIITKVHLELQKGNQESIHNRMTAFNERRREKQPLEYPSAGSTFKRPAGYFAGKLIQDAGFRGFSIGGAQLSEKHCGFVINRNHATAGDILKLIAAIQDGVLKKFGVELEKEVVVIGEDA